MKRQIWYYPLTFVAIALAIGYTQSSAVRGEPEASAGPANDPAAEFTDKIVLLEVNRSSALESRSSSVVLVNVRISKLGNRDFVVGDGYAPEDGDSDDYWYKDVLVGIPCDSVMRFHAMTPDQFGNYIKLWKDRSKE